jgi:hypothetical protein
VPGDDDRYLGLIPGRQGKENERSDLRIKDLTIWKTDFTLGNDIFTFVSRGWDS